MTAQNQPRTRRGVPGLPPRQRALIGVGYAAVFAAVDAAAGLHLWHRSNSGGHMALLGDGILLFLIGTVTGLKERRKVLTRAQDHPDPVQEAVEIQALRRSWKFRTVMVVIVLALGVTVLLDHRVNPGLLLVAGFCTWAVPQFLITCLGLWQRGTRDIRAKAAAL